MLPAPRIYASRLRDPNPHRAAPLQAQLKAVPLPPLHHHEQTSDQRQEDSTVTSLRRLTATRRSLLAVVSLATASCLLPADGATLTQEEIIYVSHDGGNIPSGSTAFPSISEALEAALPGARILISAGRYQEKLTITKPVALEAHPKGADVEVVWETQSPYQHTIECSFPGAQGASGGGSDGGALGSGEVLLRGLHISHYSKSIANNYGVFINAGSPILQECDISSSSGTGVGIEGACQPVLSACRIHDCAGHGVAVFGALVPPDDSAAACIGTEARMRGCIIEGNKLDGVLLRAGASADVQDCDVHGNGGFGLNLQDAGGTFRNNTVERNGRGAVFVVPSFDLDLDLDSLRSVNKLLGDVLVK